jgi:PPIC-type PPIASE domain
MSSVFSSSSLPSRTHPRLGLPSWSREPLFHFIVLGALLFAIDHFVFGTKDDPRVIVVDAEVDREAIDVFRGARGREPNEDELYALRRVWLDNEVLYREGLEMQLDKGDKSIRERVIFKALSVIDAGTKLPKYDDQMLRGWFESHREKYDEPARFDFQEAVLDGDSSEAALRSFAGALNAGGPGEAQAGLRVFNGRPHSNVVEAYGEEFAKALETAPLGEWGVLKSKSGWRVMRLEAISEPKPAEFENLRGVVLQDWTDVTMAEQRSAAVRALAKKYTINTEGASE